MVTKLRRALIAPTIIAIFYLSAFMLELLYKMDEDYVEAKLDYLEEKWWGREDHKIPHWEKAKS